MDKDVTTRDSCRLCGGKKLELVVPFVPTPIADAFVSKDQLQERQPVYSLDLYFCSDCGSVQLREVVNPRLLFGSNYTYMSGASAGMVRHFSEYAEMVQKEIPLPPNSLIVEIGSNDGVLLKMFKDKGHRVLGIDPAEKVAKVATDRGIETLPEFFSIELARRIKKKYGAAAVVIANNVFAHADDMAGMVNGVRELLSPDGLFVFEASYVVDVVDRMLLGALFHEHLCHHAVKPLQTFFKNHGLELVHVERVTIQGGSIIGFVQMKGGKKKVSTSVTRLIEKERARGFDRPAVYKEFSARINRLRDDVRRLLGDLKSEGKIIVGFGAARGGTTLIFHFGLADFLEYIVDDNTENSGFYSPGVHIPVLSSKVLYEKKPDYLFLLAWVHGKSIMEKHKEFLNQGGHFVLAHPKLEVV